VAYPSFPQRTGFTDTCILNTVRSRFSPCAPSHFDTQPKVTPILRPLLSTPYLPSWIRLNSASTCRLVNIIDTVAEILRGFQLPSQNGTYRWFDCVRLRRLTISLRLPTLNFSHPSISSRLRSGSSSTQRHCLIPAQNQPCLMPQRSSPIMIPTH
jgi:hypothetical protein